MEEYCQDQELQDQKIKMTNIPSSLKNIVRISLIAFSIIIGVGFLQEYKKNSSNDYKIRKCKKYVLKQIDPKRKPKIISSYSFGANVSYFDNSGFRKTTYIPCEL